MRTKVNFNKQKYVVLLIGASEYKNTAKFADIPNVRANIERMKSIFLDKRYIGVSERNLIVSLNEDSVAIKHALTKACRLARNSDYTLFVYYSGHGIINPDNYKLYFATSTMDANYLGDDAIEARCVLEKISRSAASRKIFVVDACHSGGIHNAMGDAPEAALMKNYEGVHFVSACDEDSTALFPKNKPCEPTFFTGAIVSRVSKGMDISKPFLSLREIVDDITIEFMGKNLPKPQQSSMLNADKMPFVKNVRAGARNFGGAISNCGKVVDLSCVSGGDGVSAEPKTVKSDNKMYADVSIKAAAPAVGANAAHVAARLAAMAAAAVIALMCLMPKGGNGGCRMDSPAASVSGDTVKAVSEMPAQYVVSSQGISKAAMADSLMMATGNGDMYLNTAAQIYAEEAVCDPGNGEIAAKAENAKAILDEKISYWLQAAIIDAEAISDPGLRSDAVENIDKLLNCISFDENKSLYCDMEDLRRLVTGGDQAKVNEWLASHKQYQK